MAVVRGVLLIAVRQVDAEGYRRSQDVDQFVRSGAQEAGGPRRRIAVVRGGPSPELN